MASGLIEKKLYNETIDVVHNPFAKGRAPRYKIDGKSVRGVTTILGKVMAKDFVGWALDCMASELAEKLPIITQADIEEAKKASTRKRDAGASTGTDAHALVENFLKGDAPSSGVLSHANPESVNAYRAFVKWFRATKPKVINVEEVIYSVEYGYAGTYDCMLEIDGKVILGDYKTTNTSRLAPNGIYAENFLQLGAYAQAHEEQRLYEEANGGTKLVKIDDLAVLSGKKNGKFDYVTASDLGLSVQDCSGMFKRVMNLYTFMQYATKALGGS